MKEEMVVLVDANDQEIGTAPKLQVHREGRLHRAISVFILNDRGEMLLQRRAPGKYHSGGLWSNACCSHPRPGEKPRRAAVRRLREELGIRCEVEHAFTFLYHAPLGDGLVEHEVDHVFVGVANHDPNPDPDEVMEWRWAPVEEIEGDIAERPDRFTAWFPPAFSRVVGLRAGSLSAPPLGVFEQDDPR